MRQLPLAYPIAVFVDGAYLRKVASSHHQQFPKPRDVVLDCLSSGLLPAGIHTRHAPPSSDPYSATDYAPFRINYYEAEDADTTEAVRRYWKTIGHEQDTTVFLGNLKKARRRGRVQKQVDVKLTVDMLSGALTGTYEAALLVAGDSDFVPLVEEVRRHSVPVALAASRLSVAEALRQAVDRFGDIEDYSWDASGYHRDELATWTSGDDEA